MEATQEELDRFMSYVDKLPNGCWFWTGGRSRGKGNRKWYGSFWFRGKSIRAHRFSCDHIGAYRPLPPGHDRDHSCVFSLCVNPEHLGHLPSVENNRLRDARKATLTFPDHAAIPTKVAYFSGVDRRAWPYLEEWPLTTL